MPVFYVTDEDKTIIKEIEDKLTMIIVDNNTKKRNLQIKLRVRSIYSLLAIEANSLSLETVEILLIIN